MHKKNWLNIPDNCDFTLANFPFGIATFHGHNPRVVSAIGDFVIDLSVLNELGYFSKLNILPEVFENNFLNDFISLGKKTTNAVRVELINLFSQELNPFDAYQKNPKRILHSISEVEMKMPVKVANYTDFYSSIQHATNVGSMFRDPKNALLPNYRHIPIGYHGRASSITVSGTNFKRPNGQMKAADQELPVFGPCKQLDFELEVAFITGKSTLLGEVIEVDKAEDYIFGMVLFNDWSARDIQSWEYVPLGPFLAKNFCSTISPWVITIEALEPYRTAGEKQDPPVLPYLKCSKDHNFDINLEVYLKTPKGHTQLIAQSNYKYMYWNLCQQLAHHTSNGCNIQVGDMYASGTISGVDQNSYGSMLELTWRGTKPIELADGTTRKFVDDGDSIIIKGFAGKGPHRVGFGKAEACVLPAVNYPLA